MQSWGEGVERQVPQVVASRHFWMRMRDSTPPAPPCIFWPRPRPYPQSLTHHPTASPIWHRRYDELLISKNDLEASYEDRLNKAEEKYQAQLAALDAQYQQKIIAEMERYQELARERDAVNCRCALHVLRALCDMGCRSWQGSETHSTVGAH